ncbi:hypothetical protein D3C76_1567160 [compost metagenome]
MLIDALSHDRDGLNNPPIRAVERHLFQRVQVNCGELQLLGIGDQILNGLARSRQAAMTQYDFPSRFNSGDSAWTCQHVSITNQRQSLNRSYLRVALLKHLLEREMDCTALAIQQPGFGEHE